jgi:hypothetical protein
MENDFEKVISVEAEISEKKFEEAIKEAIDFGSDIFAIKNEADLIGNSDALLFRAAKESGVSPEEVKRETEKTGFFKEISKLKGFAQSLKRRLGTVVMIGAATFLVPSGAQAVEFGDINGETTAKKIFVKAQKDFSQGVEKEISPELKELASDASNEWVFIFIQSKEGRARLVGYVPGTGSKAVIDSCALLKTVEAKRFSDDDEIVGIHNHPLEGLKNIEWTKKEIKSPPKGLIEKEITQIREGKLAPIPMPPSQDDIFNFIAGMTASISSEKYAVSGKVADTLGIWKFSIDEEMIKFGKKWNLAMFSEAVIGKKRIPEHILNQFKETIRKYDYLQTLILEPYSQKAFEQHEKGSEDLLKKEIENKNKITGELQEILKNIGVILTFTPYS